MLQVAERSFLAPSEMINIFYLFQGKLIGGEIGNDILINPFCDPETGHTQPHVVFGPSVRDIVKGDRFAYIAV